MQVNFEQQMLKQAYERKVSGLGDKLPLIKEVVDWNVFVPLIRGVFQDNEATGGRPHTDEKVVARMFILQGMYNLSDPELEYQVNDRLSFRNFVDFSNEIPDYSTVWKIREKLQERGIDKQIWELFQRHLERKGYRIEKGVIQDASFLDADLGRKRYSKEKKAKKHGEKN